MKFAYINYCTLRIKALLAAYKPLILLDFHRFFNDTPTKKSTMDRIVLADHRGFFSFFAFVVSGCFDRKAADRRQTNVQAGVSGRQALFFSWPRSMMSPKLRALYSPTLLAWRTMRSGRGLLSSVDSRTMCTLSATSTPFSFLVVSTCR